MYICICIKYKCIFLNSQIYVNWKFHVAEFKIVIKCFDHPYGSGTISKMMRFYLEELMCRYMYTRNVRINIKLYATI